MRFVALAAAVLGAALAAQSHRIVSTGPSITEMLFALGLGDRVVGVTDYCHYPKEAERLPKIGSWMKPNLEAILALRPDLVIVQRTGIHQRQPLAAIKLRTHEIGNDSIATIYESLGSIAAAAGAPDRAAPVIARIRKELDEVRQSTKGRPPVRLMFVVGRTPKTLDNMIVVGMRSYLSEVMEIAGGRNAFEDAPVAYPKISHEELLARDPDVILDMGEMAQTAGVTEAHKRSVEALYDRFPNLKAVRAKRVHAVASDIFVVPGPRVGELAREFRRLLHPR